MNRQAACREICRIKHDACAKPARFELFHVRQTIAGKSYGPGQVAFATIAAAIQKAADTAKGETDQQARREQIGHRQQRQLMPPNKPPQGQHRPKKGSINDEPSFGEFQDIEHGFADAIRLETRIPVFDDVEQSGTDDSEQQETKGEGKDRIGRKSHLLRTMHRQQDSGNHAA